MEYDVRDGKYLFKRALDNFREPDLRLFPDHYHTEYELLYMLSGDAFFVFKGRKYHMTPRCLQVVKPGEYHHIEVMPNTPYERIVIRFSEADMPAPLRPPVKELMPLYNTINPELIDVLLELETIIRMMKGQVMINSLVSALNILLGYLVSGHDTPKKPIASNDKLKTILSYIDGNITELNTIEDVCKGLYISKTALSKVFSSHLSTSVMEYIRTQKCMKAQSLLLSGAKASEVYITCGFNDYSSFYRNYLKIFGEPPSKHSKR